MTYLNLELKKTTLDVPYFIIFNRIKPFFSIFKGKKPSRSLFLPFQQYKTLAIPYFSIFFKIKTTATTTFSIL